MFAQSLHQQRRTSLPRVASVLLSLILWPVLALGGPADEVWLSGVDPYVRWHSMHETNDYMRLFDDESDWAHAVKSVNFFKTSTQYLAQASDGDLETIIEGLRKRGIKFAMEGLMIPLHAACGLGVESYSAPGTIATPTPVLRASAPFSKFSPPSRMAILSGIVDWRRRAFSRRLF